MPEGEERKDLRIGKQVFMDHKIINAAISEQSKTTSGLTLFPDGDYYGVVENVSGNMLDVKFTLRGGKTVNVLIPIDSNRI